MERPALAQRDSSMLDGAVNAAPDQDGARFVILSPFSCCTSKPCLELLALHPGVSYPRDACRAHQSAEAVRTAHRGERSRESLSVGQGFRSATPYVLIDLQMAAWPPAALDKPHQSCRVVILNRPMVRRGLRASDDLRQASALGTSQPAHGLIFCQPIEQKGVSELRSQALAIAGQLKAAGNRLRDDEGLLDGRQPATPLVSQWPAD